MTRSALLCSVLAGISIMGCAAAPSRPTAQPEAQSPSSAKVKLPPAAQGKYERALREMAARDAKGDWSDEACASSAALFLEAAAESGHPVPRYNAGVAYLRCKKAGDAKAQFLSAVGSDRKLTSARVRLALIALDEGGPRALDKVIADLAQASIDARFSDLEALTALAMLQLSRGGQAADSDGANDFERAKKNIQRALAIDDSYMPAYNQLALYYLALAKRSAVSAGSGGRAAGPGSATPAKRGRSTSSTVLELAALVCSQAVRKDARFAPIHNTAGLVHVEMGDISAAVQAFGRARALDPSLFEGHMNFAAVNMQFRGFTQAKEAYLSAVKLRPEDYDARLGLALALRAELDGPGAMKVDDALREIEAAKRIAPDRPEAYYNEAILTQEYVSSPDSDPDASLLKAKSLFGAFVSKAKGAAGGEDRWKGDIVRAKERMADIDQIIHFRKQTKEEQAMAEDAKRQRDAEAAAAAGAGAEPGAEE